MRTLISILVLLVVTNVSTKSSAKEFHLLDVEELNMEYFKYEGQYRDSYYVHGDSNPIQMSSGAALNMRLQVANYLYWDNRFHLDNDDGNRVRAAGWQWEAGARIPWVPLDFFQHHHSRHILDIQNPRGDKFPLENTYGVRIHFIGGGDR